MIPLFIWILCPADIVYLIKIDILGSRIKVMKKWCLHIFIWRYKGICLLYSPRMWRWSPVRNIVCLVAFVFSTYVEVILSNYDSVPYWQGILHVCGGDPLPDTLPQSELEYSPRMWRWSLIKSKQKEIPPVFSTYVEVILLYVVRLGRCHSILHVCGGDPVLSVTFEEDEPYSPRMWRWS